MAMMDMGPGSLEPDMVELDQSPDMERTLDMNPAPEMGAAIVCETTALEENSGWTGASLIDPQGQGKPLHMLLDQTLPQALATYEGSVSDVNGSGQQQYITIEGEAWTEYPALLLRMLDLPHPKTPTLQVEETYEVTYGRRQNDCWVAGGDAPLIVDAMALRDDRRGLLHAKTQGVLSPNGEVRLAPGFPIEYDAITWEPVPECLDQRDGDGTTRARISMTIDGAVHTFTPGHAEVTDKDGSTYAVHTVNLKTGNGIPGICGYWTLSVGPVDKKP